MGAETVALLVIVGVIVTAIALHLIAIAATLSKISRTLVKVKGGVVAIKGQTDPVTEVITGLAGDVAAIDDDLEGLLEIVGEAQAAVSGAPAPPPAARPTKPARRSSPAPVLVRDEEIAEFEDDLAEDDETAVAELSADADYEDDEDEPVHRPSMAEAVARARAGV